MLELVYKIMMITVDVTITAVLVTFTYCLLAALIDRIKKDVRRFRDRRGGATRPGGQKNRYRCSAAPKHSEQISDTPDECPPTDVVDKEQPANPHHHIMKTGGAGVHNQEVPGVVTVGTVAMVADHEMDIERFEREIEGIVTNQEAFHRWGNDLDEKEEKHWERLNKQGEIIDYHAEQLCVLIKRVSELGDRIGPPLETYPAPHDPEEILGGEVTHLVGTNKEPGKLTVGDSDGPLAGIDLAPGEDMTVTKFVTSQEGKDKISIEKYDRKPISSEELLDMVEPGEIGVEGCSCAPTSKPIAFEDGEMICDEVVEDETGKDHKSG